MPEVICNFLKGKTLKNTTVIRVERESNDADFHISKAREQGLFLPQHDLGCANGPATDRFFCNRL